MEYHDPRGVTCLVMVLSGISVYLGIQRKENVIVWWIAGAAIGLWIGGIFDHYRLAWIFDEIITWGFMFLLISAIVIAICLGINDRRTK